MKWIERIKNAGNGLLNNKDKGKWKLNRNVWRRKERFQRSEREKRNYYSFKGNSLLKKKDRQKKREKNLNSAENMERKELER